MQLPTAFRSMMQRLLEEDWPLFDNAMQRKACRAVRLHRWQDEVPPTLDRHLLAPIPWAPEAFYVTNDSSLAKTVYHEAGSLYFQEPSAMAVARAVQPKPNERILDLCAAPGSKTTHLASQMPHSCCLIANEIHPKRVSVLAENMERMGVNGAVINADPTQLSAVWREQFDAILVDAPCSGEGMFRKSDAALSEWTEETPGICAARQRSILKSAASMVRPNGRIIYSTCTFNPIENEQIVAWMEDELGFDIQPFPETIPEWTDGRPDWADGRASLTHTKRCWPHLTQGEGHFLALLVKRSSARHVQNRDLEHPKLDPLPHEWIQYVNEHCSLQSAKWCLMQPVTTHHHIIFFNRLYDLPTNHIRILRPGTAIGTVHKKRFTPHHALSHFLPALSFRHRISLDESEAIRYFGGEALANDGHAQGFVAVCHQNLSLGFAKAVPGRLNNLYPKGLRKTQLMALN